MIRSVWVIEEDSDDRDEDQEPDQDRWYFTVTEGPTGSVAVWTRSIKDAVQFNRSDDALQVAMLLRMNGSVTEHFFTDTVGRSPNQEIDETRFHGDPAILAEAEAGAVLH